MLFIIQIFITQEMPLTYNILINHYKQLLLQKKIKCFFIINKKNLDIIVKFKKKMMVKKMWFFLAMVRLRYAPTDNDLSLKVEQLLRRVWNINSHCDKRENVECIIYEEWAIEVFLGR